MLSGRDTQTLLDGKKNFKLYAFVGGRKAKTLTLSPVLAVLALTSQTSQLVKFLLPLFHSSIQWKIYILDKTQVVSNVA